MIKIACIQVTQPIGTFYIASIPANMLVDFAKISRKKDNNFGVQRDDSRKRIESIKNYCSDPDATFPTSIVLSVKMSSIESIKDGVLEFYKEQIVAYIIDGQHRVLGIKEANNIDDFDLPVVIMFDLIPEEEAYVFSTINSTQTKVPKSHIYQLFDVYETASPQNTCHIIARALNDSKDSPFFKRLKMLGIKSGEMETLSQGTFAEHLISLISKNPQEDAIAIKLKGGKRKYLEPNIDIVFRKAFIEDNDNLIYQGLLDYFNVVKTVFYYEWHNPREFIISKTTGYGALMKVLKELKKGNKDSKLNLDDFENLLYKFQVYLTECNRDWKSIYYQSSGSSQSQLSKQILDLQKNNNEEVTNKVKKIIESGNLKSLSKSSIRNNIDNLSWKYSFPLLKILELLNRVYKNDISHELFNNFEISADQNIAINFYDGSNTVTSLYICVSGNYPKSNKPINEYMKSIVSKPEIVFSKSDPESVVWISNELHFKDNFIKSRIPTLYHIILDILNLENSVHAVQLSSSELFYVYRRLNEIFNTSNDL